MAENVARREQKKRGGLVREWAQKQRANGHNTQKTRGMLGLWA